MRKLLGAALLILGVRMLAYRGFSYTRDTHEARIGGIGVRLKQRERVEIPVWAGAVVTLAGGGLLAAGSRGGRRRS
jgi:hypothetical protein